MPYRLKPVAIQASFKILDVTIPVLHDAAELAEALRRMKAAYNEWRSKRTKPPYEEYVLNGRLGLCELDAKDSRHRLPALTFTGHVMENHPWYEKSELVGQGACELLDLWRESGIRMRDGFPPIIVYSGRAWKGDHTFRQD